MTPKLRHVNVHLDFMVMDVIKSATIAIKKESVLVMKLHAFAKLVMMLTMLQ